MLSRQFPFSSTFSLCFLCLCANYPFFLLFFSLFFLVTTFFFFPFSFTFIQYFPAPLQFPLWFPASSYFPVIIFPSSLTLFLISPSALSLARFLLSSFPSLFRILLHWPAAPPPMYWKGDLATNKSLLPNWWRYQHLSDWPINGPN